MIYNMPSTQPDSFYMPAEFEPHDSTWMLWPERPDVWRKNAAPAQKVFAKIAAAISAFEPVYMGVLPSHFEAARKMLPESVHLVKMEYNDAWMRDVGPSFVVNTRGEIRGVDWKFNAWGGDVDGLYTDWQKDDSVASQVCKHEQIETIRLENLIMEGGAIHCDGEGTLITTESCLLSKGRNHAAGKKFVENQLCTTLGVEKVIWIPEGMYMDETNGHIDNLLQIVSPGRILLSWTNDPSDPQYSISQTALNVLSTSTDARGRSFEIVKLHIPDPKPITEAEASGIQALPGSEPRNAGDRLAASYANCYLANGAVILPLFGDERYDAEAIEIMKQEFSDREIIGIESREVLLGGGNIHCITQQKPKTHNSLKHTDLPG
jgi:agmatine deiminase